MARTAEVPRKIKLGLYATQEEYGALEFIYKTNHHRYPDGRAGVASVLRDYSVNDAVAHHRRAKAELKAG